MTTPFGASYSGTYDALYGEKDYAAECAFIEAQFAAHAAAHGAAHAAKQGAAGPGAPVRTVLDLGCGTGSHAIPLARHGYAVTGLDRSEAMLAQARAKAAAAELREPPSFVAGDVRHADLGRTFDAAIMMFAVLGYQTGNDEVLDTLRSVRRHLAPGAPFLFDVWHGPAVLKIGPSPRVKVVRAAGETLIRAADGALDVERQTCAVRYQLWRMRGTQLVDETEETHVMRYFFPQELALFLQMTGFALVAARTLDADRPPTESDWNVVCTARAV